MGKAHWNRDGSRASGLGRGAAGFWNKVVKRPDGCWVWLGYLDKDGAGKFCTLVEGKRITIRAAVYAWRELVGDIAAKHSLIAIVCWNARCVNPSHRMLVPHCDLSRWFHGLGRRYEHADNRGAMSGRTTLKDDDVLFMRSQPRVYGLVPVLARLYGVKAQVVSNLLRRKTWQHIGNGNKQNAMPLATLRDLADQRANERGATIDDLAQQRREVAA